VAQVVAEETEVGIALILKHFQIMNLAVFLDLLPVNLEHRAKQG